MICGIKGDIDELRGKSLEVLRNFQVSLQPTDIPSAHPQPR